MRHIFPVVCLVPALAAGVMWWRVDREKRDAWARVAQLETERAAAAGAASPAPMAEAAASAPVSAVEPKVVRVPAGTDPAPYLKMIDELRENLKEQARELSVVRESVSRAEAAAATEQEEVRKLRTQAEDLREDAQSARRLSDALQVELRAKSDRLLKVETAEKLLQERVTRAESAAGKVAGVSREVEDLNRRREAYLTTLLRRYREVNDLYRNYTLNAPTRDAAGAGLQAGDLSRIQSTIQQAEDDLRQLQALNARAAQLARAK
ncbi:MAG: hypothetical protein JNM66_06025 [Bryobacterales bacterium]|nr:hypothetical protein [Bryobacterales bacterium]